MFNLPAPKKAENELENIIILRLDELIIGIVVDTIEKVVGN
jgi:chemotaxis signal transduction protein